MTRINYGSLSKSTDDPSFTPGTHIEDGRKSTSPSCSWSSRCVLWSAYIRTFMHTKENTKFLKIKETYQRKQIMSITTLNCKK